MFPREDVRDDGDFIPITPRLTDNVFTGLRHPERAGRKAVEVRGQRSIFERAAPGDMERRYILGAKWHHIESRRCRHRSTHTVSRRKMPIAVIVSPFTYGFTSS